MQTPCNIQKKKVKNKRRGEEEQEKSNWIYNLQLSVHCNHHTFKNNIWIAMLPFCNDKNIMYGLHT